MAELNKAKVAKAAKGIGIAILVGGVWTRARLRESGYLVSDGCVRCGELDTLMHRLHRCCCPEVQAARAALPQLRELIARGAAAAEGHPLYCRA